jgi:hypothetical protein
LRDENKHCSARPAGDGREYSCVGLVLVILVPVWFMTERWLEQQSQRVLDYMIWREPSGPWDL